jgi:elongation factor Ts
MAKITASMADIKILREKTGAGIMNAKKALEESAGDMKKAEAWIREKGIQLADKKAGREVKEGIVTSYVHMGGRIGALVELNCETDFVAKTDDFVNLGREVAMQIASMQPKDVAELLDQPYIRDPKTTVRDLIKSVAGKVGENVAVSRFARFALGETEAPKS